MDGVYKIIKKHVKSRNYDHDVFALKYKFPIFHFWKEFPVYFESEYVLKDFVEHANIFDFHFWAFHNNSSFINFSYKYKSFKKDYIIKLSSLWQALDHCIFRDGISDFIVGDLHQESTMYWGRTLSMAFNKFYNATKTGITDIEEKTYKLTCE